MEIDKENAFPAMCSTPLVGKRVKSRQSFCRTPLTPVNSNFLIKRGNPAEVEALKEYIKELRTSFKEQFQEQKEKYEAQLSAPIEVIELASGESDSPCTPRTPCVTCTSIKLEVPECSKEVQCDLSDHNCSISDSQLAALQRQLMKSNLERDEVKGSVVRQQGVIVQISQDKDRLFQENAQLTIELDSLRAEAESSSKASLDTDHQSQMMTLQQNYQILSNSHQELEMQMCHISTELDAKNARVSTLFAECKATEEKLRVSEQRCVNYEEKVVMLENKCSGREKQFGDQVSEAKKLGREIEELRQEFYSTKLEKSRIRGEMEFLLDERETRDATQEELYKLLTESRKELARVELSEEALQARCDELSEVCEEAVKSNNINKELVSDAMDLSKFLCSAMRSDLPPLCAANSVEYDEVHITENCPAIMGDLIFLDHAFKLLKDVAGGVTINKNARSTIYQLKEDKAKLEETCQQLKYFTAEQKERLTRTRQYLTKAREEKAALEEAVKTDATLVEEYSERCRAEHERALQLHDKSERFSLKVARQEEQLSRANEQLELYDTILNTVKRKMLALGSSLPSSLRVVLNELV